MFVHFDCFILIAAKKVVLSRTLLDLPDAATLSTMMRRICLNSDFMSFDLPVAADRLATDSDSKAAKSSAGIYGLFHIYGCPCASSRL